MTALQAPQGKPRLAFLDMTKGILVILMVVYHSLNYTNQYHLGFRYLSFLPPSFILLTGFLISQVYGSRYRRGDRTFVQRLLVRGVKLLALFTVLNIAAQYIRSPAYGQSIGVSNLFKRWDQVLFLGSERAAVFEVLLPIAYVLIMAPVFVWLSHYKRLLLPTITLCFVAACALFDQKGASLLNLNLISAGVLGIAAGNSITTPITLGRRVWLSLAAFCIYFRLGMTVGYVYVVQLLGACVALAFFCGLSIRLGDTGWWQQRIIRLGQYSLMAYIVQIAILQMLSRILGRPDPLSIEALALLLVTLLFMTLIIESVHRARKRLFGAERCYTLVFA